MADLPPPAPIEPAIVITASRTPEAAGESAASATVINSERLARLGEPLLAGYLRLAPSVSLASSGPAGSLSEVRIRGAEANHTLLFIDGMRANDPASGNIPRFELLNADIASRIELVRGPQSALWGSEAIGGVVAVSGADPAGSRLVAGGESGSFGFARGYGSASHGTETAGFAIAGGYQRARGIDSFDGSGDREGYDNASVRALGRLVIGAATLSASGFLLEGRSDFDGFDPVTFLRADTDEDSRNRMLAGRLGVALGETGDSWSGSLSASMLGSSNRNYLADAEQNRTAGRRLTLDGQVNRRFATGTIDHRLTLAGTYARERFAADDTAFGGFTRQRQTRGHWAVTGEWRASMADRLVASVALRHDGFNRFRDATSLRASLLARVAGPLSIAASYGEGIAQPTFFDLYGFFPGSFVGNPALRPERSRGWEIAARWQTERLSASLTYHRQRLTDEIVGTYDPATFLSSAANADGRSRREGIEAEAAWSPGAWLRLSAHYAWLDADEPVSSGRLREQRRPRHTGSVAADGTAGRFSYGASLAYVGRRIDTDFDVFPARRVTLGAYWLAGARVAWRATDTIEIFGRVANAFDESYQDVVGYRTEGRSAAIGLRLALAR